MDTREAGIYNAVIIGAIVLGIILGYFVWTMLKQMQRHQRATAALHKAEIAVVELERFYLSRDLHDDLGPYVSTIAIFLSQMNPPTAEEKENLHHCMNIVEEVVKKIRHFSMSLFPYHLEEHGLIGAIETFIDQLESKLLAINLQYNSNPFLPASLSVQVYRIVQEIIHNSLKHASPGQLKIVMDFTENNLLIKTADSGQVNAPGNATLRGTGMGIRHMRSRVAQLKGDIDVDINPKTGTRYLIRIPLPAT